MIKIPKNAPETKRHGISDKDISAIEKNVATEFGLYPFIMIYTGLRRGELCALEWNDIDFKNGIIHINNSIEYMHNRPHIKPPKTESGIRIFLS